MGVNVQLAQQRKGKGKEEWEREGRSAAREKGERSSFIVEVKWEASGLGKEGGRGAGGTSEMPKFISLMVQSRK